MRVSEGRGCLQTMPSESILEQAKLGQLRIEGFKVVRDFKALNYFIGDIRVIGVIGILLLLVLL